MPENEDIWHYLAQRNQFDESAFKYASWNFFDFILGRTFDDHGDMTKARRYGWTTTVDTSECYFQCFDRLKKMKVISSN
ncbi:unnamed protein product [Rotaria sordida]|uniref:Uncharacterized protein n=1 Tax=Rotaria sordida TaxID=392033 RepID=A0A818YHT8_9BILA|nr:unnamed protein product [Rotaria sordida]CAF3754601.1 unnamed protein product [Rotaria sordida]